MSTIEKNSPSRCDQCKSSRADVPALLTEDEFLDRELHATVSRLRTEVQHVKASIPQAVDVRLWTQHYPWTSVAIAATTGFATAVLLGKPGTRHQLAPSDETRETPKSVEAAAKPSIFGGLFATVRSAIVTLVEGVSRALLPTYLENSLDPPADEELLAKPPATATDVAPDSETAPSLIAAEVESSRSS